MKRKEATTLKSFTARIPESLIHKLKLKALKERTTAQALLAEAIEDLLKKPRAEGADHE
ncbi:MAG: hypothetical protein JO166_05805 [Deltaproteobacteria bacterium]|nr:hypothetical protein [Deltaproteobacteria bacterium]